MGAKLNAQPKSLVGAGHGSREVGNERDQRGHSSVPAALQVRYVSIPTSHRPSATCRAISGTSAPARDAGDFGDPTNGQTEVSFLLATIDKLHRLTLLFMKGLVTRRITTRAVWVYTENFL